MATATAPAPSTRNITKLFRQATPDQISAGLDWYRDAHDIAGGLASEHGTTIEVTSGVIAALSPLNSWVSNVGLAGRFLAAGGLDAGYLSTGLRKAQAILDGADIIPTLSGEKTQNFYRSIMTAGADGVTIDRHSWSLSVNIRYSDDNFPSLRGKRYALAVAAHERAARILSKEYGMLITPAQTQATTWTLWRLKFWSAGAFDVAA